jgi:hypothetical protein
MAKRIAILGTWTIYEGWMKIIRVKVQIDAEQIEREVEDHGRAVAVLPYETGNVLSKRTRLAGHDAGGAT